MALDARLAGAVVMAQAGNALVELNDFGKAVEKSVVVMARKLSALDAMVNSGNSSLTTFYQQFRAGQRLPEDTVWDRGRQSADSAINPYYFEDLHYASLSMDGVGASWYGQFHITFKDQMISERTTFFEENPMIFCKKHHVNAGSQPPLGYRALWPSRGKLAQAKLQNRIHAGTTPDEYPGILLSQGDGPDADFVEAHIHGPLHRSAIASVLVTEAPKGAQRHIWRTVKRRLVADGVKLQEA